MSDRIFRPEEFGAVGDGKTDDTAAIQAAINAAAAAGGVEIHLSKPAYRVEALELKKNTKAILAGRKTT